MANCSEVKTSGLDGLPYELHKSMPNLFRHPLANMYANWQQNGLIYRSVRRGVVTLIRKNPVKRFYMENFQPITLINTEL